MNQKHDLVAATLRNMISLNEKRPPHFARGDKITQIKDDYLIA